MVQMGKESVKRIVQAKGQRETVKLLALFVSEVEAGINMPRPII